MAYPDTPKERLALDQCIDVQVNLDLQITVKGRKPTTSLDQDCEMGHGASQSLSIQQHIRRGSK